ncbi:unnamed protein product, partial [Rotaria sordida]
LAEFFGEDVIKDKGLCCRFVIANVPRDTPVTERAIPLAIFQSEQSIRNHYLRKWLHLSTYHVFKKTTTLKRKRNELHDKTITHQWRIVLGPPPIFGQTINQHIKWLNYQKHKWNIQYEQRLNQSSIISDKIQLKIKQKNLNDGIFKAWCLVEHELIQIKIKVPRIFYVNYRTSIENNNIQTQHSIVYEHTINNCSKRVNRLLPRCSQIYYLYEYRLDENHFYNYYTDIMTDLSNLNIEGVYEMNVPLDFR